MVIADLGRLADYVSNHSDLVVENETMSEAFSRAVPLISKEIEMVISSSPERNLYVPCNFDLYSSSSIG